MNLPAGHPPREAWRQRDETARGWPSRPRRPRSLGTRTAIGSLVQRRRSRMRRREFIAGISSAAAWPLAARAQQADRVRRIGILVPAVADDPEFQARVRAFLQELAQLGWAIGGNLQIEMHGAGSNPADIRRHAAQLAASGPDVILTHGALTVRTLIQETRGLPIVFATTADPVADGFVESLARPGGNATGFLSYEYSS